MNCIDVKVSWKKAQPRMAEIRGDSAKINIVRRVPIIKKAWNNAASPKANPTIPERENHSHCSELVFIGSSVWKMKK